MEIKLTKKAALAAADVLSIWLENTWELDEDFRAQVVALDQLLEQLGSAWDEYKEKSDQEAQERKAEREEEDLRPEALKRLLEVIWRNGDQDEMSWKHLGHAFAALVHFGDWKLAKDYERPWIGTIPNNEKSLEYWWERVAKIYEAAPEETLEEAERLSKDQGGMFSHLTAYLDDYEGAAH